MTVSRPAITSILSLLLLTHSSFCFTANAEDTVTISKQRLEELLKKETELEKLRAITNKIHGEKLEPKISREPDTPRLSSPSAVPRAPVHASPPIACLPPLSTNETVEAMDLANYYRNNPAAADARFRKRTFKVQGEVAAFEKPLLVRDYRVILKTGERELRVIADVVPPETIHSVFTTKHGLQLVGAQSGRTGLPIANVGDVVIIEGQCRGMSDLTVKLSGCELKSVKAAQAVEK